MAAIWEKFHNANPGAQCPNDAHTPQSRQRLKAARQSRQTAFLASSNINRLSRNKRGLCNRRSLRRRRFFSFNLGRRLILAQPFEGGLPNNQAGAGPAGERDLGDEARLGPIHVRLARRVPARPQNLCTEWRRADLRRVSGLRELLETFGLLIARGRNPLPQSTGGARSKKRN
jgi:hypothetical protein